VPETSYSLANLATNLSIFKPIPMQATVRHSHMTDYELEAIGDSDEVTEEEGARAEGAADISDLKPHPPLICTESVQCSAVVPSSERIEHNVTVKTTTTTTDAAAAAAAATRECHSFTCCDSKLRKQASP
jgi:hypothetical protein